VDPGVEVEWNMPPNALSQNLGFRSHRPLLFNKFRHKSGVTPWDHPNIFERSNVDLVPIKLHWHQLAGTHAILRRFLSPESSFAPSGILIADEVGLGKTLQALAVIAWLTECVGRQAASTQIPPILGKSSVTPFSLPVV
jgi:TATA-binding protein-associated factor